MASKREIQNPKKGMNRDSASFELDATEYSFALNANIQDEHGSGGIVVQNEPSNLKCSSFKDGFKVIGHKYDIEDEKTYFFLHNPTTNISEIGYIKGNQNIEGLSPIEINNNGDYSAELETPLELVTQTDSCTYITLISDYCDLTSTATGLLNFSMEHPIHESNIIIKNEKTGKNIYFTDNFNPQRYVQLDRLEIYNQEIDSCENTITETCLQVDKMRIFPLHNKPCLTPRVIQNGGNLRAGLYEALIAACDSQGNELTNYYALTNPIPVFDKNNNILDLTTLNYQTNQAIAIDVVYADQNFEYYKIAIIYRSGLDGAATVVSNGIYPSDQTSVTIATLQNKPALVLSEVISRRPHYTKAEGLSESNGYMFQYGLSTNREINLQPVVNLMGSLARWITYQAKEDLYENGVFVSNYGSYMRDEVYPLGIKFFMEGGYETSLFPLIPRPATVSEMHQLGTGSYKSDKNTQSVLEYNVECSEDLRNKRWQFENTATKTEDCLVPAGAETETIERYDEMSCFVQDENGDSLVVETIANSTFTADTTESIVDYINLNSTSIINSTGPNGQDIREVLEDPGQFPQTCTPAFGDNCSEQLELVSEEIFAISVDSETTEIVGKDYADYTRVNSPEKCSMYQLGEDAVTPTNDTTFQTNYMEVGETVYTRFPAPTNVTCASAQQLVPYSEPPTSVPTYFLMNKGQVGNFNTLQTTKTSSATIVSYNLILEGTNGTMDVDINGTIYTLTFSTSLTDLATNFVTTNAATILTDTGVVVTSSGPVINFLGEYTGFPTITYTNTAGDLDASKNVISYTDKVHSNAIWLKGTFAEVESTIVELSATLCDTPDDNSSNSLRITVFQDCASGLDLPIYTRIVEDTTIINDVTKFLELQASDFGGINSNYFIAIDSPMRQREVAGNDVYTLIPPCGCFTAFQREVSTTTIINYTNLKFGKKTTKKSLCSYAVPKLGACEAIAYQKGLFSYWESLERYPCNPELFDSSSLTVPEDAIPSDYVEEFKNYYGVGVFSGNIALGTSANFMDKPIRHYKFPDNIVAPFMSTDQQNPGAGLDSVIYPIGFFLSNDVINAFLDVAVVNGLLTVDERSRITRYEIFRGDRSVNKSVIAKGLLFDVYRYLDLSNSLKEVNYSNYPLNALGRDRFNAVNAPFNGDKNNRFTFHSPETSFEKPTLPREIKIDGYQFGTGASYFDEVRGHAPMVIMGDQAYTVAAVLAGFEVGVEILVQVSNWLVLGGTGGLSAPISIAAAITAGVSYVISALFKYGQYKYQWEETFYNLGKPTNFAYYQVCVGHYNYFQANTNLSSRLRGLAAITYMNDGKWQVTEEKTSTQISVNNSGRESSVFLTMGASNFAIDYTTNYATYDNSDIAPGSSSRIGYEGKGRSGGIPVRNASPYATLKQYNPAQYGTLTSVLWLHTNYCGDLLSSNDCDGIFGGDTTISRFSLKRKLPFFSTDAVGLPPLTPFKYSDYFNINPIAPINVTAVQSGRYYVDHLINDDSFNFLAGFTSVPNKQSTYNFDYVTGDNKFYVKLPSKFYLYSYGIPHFLVESEINCNFRYAKREAHENFYPNVGDVIEWTQEQKVSIKEPNTYFYNIVYSLNGSLYPYRTLPTTYNEKQWSGLNNLENFVIHSRQDVSQNSLTDPWLLYKALDAYEFPRSYGKLIDLDGIESEQVLGRFTNGITIFGAIDQMRDRLTPETESLGNSGIFAGRNINFNLTELGYGGTQHKTKISCEFGHFWVDAKRGKVFQLAPNGQNLEEISRSSDSINTSCEKWFKENLPFKLLRYIDSLTDLDVDNAYNGLGITMGWDDRLKRVFITKKDYIPKATVCYSAGKFYDVNPNTYQATIAQYESAGNVFIGFSNCRLKFTNDSNGSVEEVFVSAIEVKAGDSRYFDDCSFTIAYNPLLKVWVSYYSFKPNYYISYNNYFQTGINFSEDKKEIGLWSHLPFTSSYQVFYGKRYPFTIEYALKSNLANSALEHVEYNLDVRKYYDKYDFSDVFGVGFNKAVVYNNYQNTGLLNLVHQKDNDIRQNLFYPKFNLSSIDILQSEINGRWTFNFFYNLLKNERSGLPIWKNDVNQIEKVLDDKLFDYRNNMKDRLRGDYFLVRLTNDLETRYKYLFRFAVDSRNYYEQ